MKHNHSYRSQYPWIASALCAIAVWFADAFESDSLLPHWLTEVLAFLAAAGAIWLLVEYGPMIHVWAERYLG